MSTPDATPSHELTVGSYLDRLAAPSPTPGGGSAVAVAAALAAALTEMVTGITGKGRLSADAERELAAANAAAHAARTSLLALAVDDERAYASYRAAAALPKSTDEEKAARRAAVQASLVTSADVPLSIAHTALEVLSALETAARLGTKHALSDIGAGSALAQAAIAGALETVRVNVNLMSDQVRAEFYRSAISHAEETAATRAGSIASALASRDS